MKKRMNWMWVGLASLAVMGCGAESTEDCAGDACAEEAAGVAFTGANEGSAPTVGEYFGAVAEEEARRAGEEVVADETTTEVEPGTEEPTLEETQEEVVEEETTVEDLEGVSLADLDADQLAEIEVLRTAIFSGIDIGNDQYLKSVSLTLADLDITPDYGAVAVDGWDILDQPVSSCPFVEFYDNGFEPTGYACEYLVDQARSEAYSKLAAKLDSQALPTEVADSGLVEEAEARFWIEQGAISGLEENRVLVQLDIKAKGLCNKAPTPVESSKEKGLVMGRQLMVNSMNNWLTTNGYKADYPVMSEPIEVCNMNESVLNPAETDAYNTISQFMVENPLCDDFQPTSSDDDIFYGQAQADYKKAMEQGIEEEFALAAVKVFKVVPCNVSDPLVLDLDRDGLELLPVHQGVNFDFWSSGSQNAVAWTASDDGLLALDRNSNGMIDNGSELFGNINGDHADGFSQLSELDRPEFGGNGDGWITEADAAFAHLVIWQDKNTDGVSAASEIHELAAFRITGLNTVGEAVDYSQAGSPVPTANYVETADGPMLMADAFFRTAPYPSLSALVR